MAKEASEKEPLHRVSVSIPMPLYRKILELKAIAGGFPVSDSEMFRRLLTFAAEEYPRPKN